MAKIGKKQLLKYRIDMLEAGMKLRRNGENELNRRIDNLVETITEMDKRIDALSDNRDNSNNSEPPVYFGDINPALGNPKRR